MTIIEKGECLYGVLGLPKGSNIAAVAKAYKKLALQHHPDRSGGDDVIFKKLGYAYSVLKDEGKKKMYDETGAVGGDIDADNLADLVKMMFQDITEEEIGNYMEKRRGSAEEKQEVAEAYTSADGDFFAMIENVYLESYTEDIRIMKLVDGLIEEGVVEAKPKWEKTKPSVANRKKPAFKKYRSKCQKEAMEVERMREEAQNATRTKGDVAIAMKELMKEQYSALFSNLAAKYGAEEESDDDGLDGITDEQFEAMRKKMEEKKKKSKGVNSKKRSSSEPSPPAKKAKKKKIVKK